MINMSENEIKKTTERRIFIATKQQHNIGVNFDITNNKAQGFSIPYTGEEKLQGFEGMRISALSALITVIKGTDTTDIENVIPVFVNQALAEFIKEETYKFWIKTGHKQSGETVPETELNLLKEFAELWKTKGENFVVRDIFKCKINDEVKKDPAKLSKFKTYAQQNDFYSRDCWTKIAKLYNESVAQSMASVM